MSAVFKMQGSCQASMKVQLLKVILGLFMTQINPFALAKTV
jgi:hypothetical protein